jgi:low affinity Fe/Cu permease
MTAAASHENHKDHRKGQGGGAGTMVNRAFSSGANYVARVMGRPAIFALAVLSVIVWLISGPYFHYSDTWRLVINTGTTIVTFLMVFLIQNSQNRDSAAIQAKLDELIRASAAQNFYIGIERLTDEEIDEIRQKCEMRAKAAVVGREAEADVNRIAREAADAVSGVRE